jgi:hypothetical protein
VRCFAALDRQQCPRRSFRNHSVLELHARG